MPEKPLGSLEYTANETNAKKPTFCCIGISTICNLKCKMCFFWKSKYVSTRQELTLEEWQRFINLLTDLSDNTLEIDFSGGEPLLDLRNLSLVSFCSKKGVYTSIPTNGSMIDKEMARKIADSGLSVITISLDGINKNTHDFLRGTEGCYDRIMQGIGYLDKYCPSLTIGIQTIISGNNLDEIIKLAEWAEKNNRINYIVFQAIAQPFNTPIENEWWNKSEYDFLWPKDPKKTFVVLGELIRLKSLGYKISNPVSQIETFKRYFERPNHFIKKDRCNIDFYMNINQFGDMHMCVRKEPIGNIREKDLEDIWYSEEADRARKETGECTVNCHHLLNCCYKEE